MKLTILQFAPVLGDLNQTIDCLEKLFHSIRETDLIVLPELANSGYNFESKEQAFVLAEEVEESQFIQFLQKKCEHLDCAIATGFCEREGEKLYNSSVLLDKNGVFGHYRKLHLFMNEKTIFEKGDLGLPTFQYQGIKIGMLVCFDWMFPEVWRKLALQSVDLIVHPSNLVLPYAQSVIPSYALVNRIFIATANRIGKEGELEFTGQSIIASPKGEVMKRAAQKEEIIECEIDIQQARNKMITLLNDAFEDRRTDIY